MESLAVIFTLLSVYLTYKSNILCWPFGVVGAFFYLVLFHNSGNWINMSLQLIFLIQSIIGWFKWSKDRSVISYLDSRSILILVFPLWIILYLISIYFNGNESILDSLTSSLALLGIYLTSSRKVESWIVWGLCDIFLIILFIGNGMYLSSFVYFIFLIICIFGFYEWKKRLFKLKKY